MNKQQIVKIINKISKEELIKLHSKMDYEGRVLTERLNFKEQSKPNYWNFYIRFVHYPTSLWEDVKNKYFKGIKNEGMLLMKYGLLKQMINKNIIEEGSYKKDYYVSKNIRRLRELAKESPEEYLQEKQYKGYKVIDLKDYYYLYDIELEEANEITRKLNEEHKQVNNK